MTTKTIVIKKDRNSILSKIRNNKITSFLKTNDVKFAYLFGSQINGRANFQSDVDIAVYLDENCKDFLKTRLFLIEKLEGILKKNVEVIILNEQRSIFFKFVIIKEGKVIFEKDHNKRVDFELKTMQDYYDFKPFLEEYNKVYLKRELIRLGAK